MKRFLAILLLSPLVALGQPSSNSFNAIIAGTVNATTNFVGEGGGITLASDATNSVQAVRLSQLQNLLPSSSTYYLYGSSNAFAASFNVGTTANTNYCYNVPSSGGANTMTVNSVTTGEYLVSYVTADTFKAIGAGSINVDFYASFNAGAGRACSLVAEIYVLDTVANSLVVEYGTPVAQTITGSSANYVFTVAATNYTSANPLRLVAKIKVATQANNPNVSIVTENGQASHIDFNIPSSSFVLKSGDTMTGALIGTTSTMTTVNDATVNAGTLNVTNTTKINGITYTWPSTNALTGQVLQNNGSGLVTWTNVTATGGSSMVGTVSNNVASAGLLAVDATKTNGVAATPAMVTNALGGFTANASQVIGADNVARYGITNYQVLDFRNYGGYSDGVCITNVSMTNGSSYVFCPTMPFTIADVGKTIRVVQAAGGANNYDSQDLVGFITNYVNASNVIISAVCATNGGNLVFATNVAAFYGHDDATNFQNAITFCYNNNISRLRMDGMTIIGGDMQDTNSWNSIIKLPSVNGQSSKNIENAWSFTIEGAKKPEAGPGAAGLNGFTGGDYGTVIWPGSSGTWIVVCNLGSRTVAAATGASASFMCAGTNYTGGASNPSVVPAGFNAIHPTIKEIGIRLPSNPLISGFNFVDASGCEFDHVLIDSTYQQYAGPVLDYTFAKDYAIALPANGNSLYAKLNRVELFNFWTGIYAYEHAHLDDVFIANTISGLQVLSAHEIYGAHIMFQSCGRCIVSQGAQVDFSMVDIEHDKYPSWTYLLGGCSDVFDQSNNLRGRMSYNIYNSSQGAAMGINPTVLNCDGGTNLIKIDLSSQSVPTRYSARSLGVDPPSATNLILNVDLTDQTAGLHNGSTNKQTIATWTATPKLGNVSFSNPTPALGTDKTNIVVDYQFGSQYLVTTTNMNLASFASTTAAGLAGKAQLIIVAGGGDVIVNSALGSVKVLPNGIAFPVTITNGDWGLFEFFNAGGSNATNNAVRVSFPH